MPAVSTSENWHLDKKVPLAIVASILFQSAVIIWWGSKLDHRVEVSEQRIIELSSINKLQDARVDQIERDRQVNLQRLSRTEQAISDVRELMSKIDGKLDRLTERAR